MEKIFVATLKNRVSQYFIDHAISDKGNSTLYLKTVFWLGLWFTFYASLYIPFSPEWIRIWIFFPMLGIFSAGIGFNIMHDASHGAYAEKKKLNTLLSFTLELVGPLSFLWLTKHVTIHHTFVNTDHDDDIESGGLIRMSPNQPKKWFHKYQHIYAPFLYGLLAFQWIYIADFKKYFSKKIHTKNIEISTNDKITFWIAKICNVIFFIIIPVWVLGPDALIGWALYLFVVGFLISVVFQLAHIHEYAEFQKTNEKNKLVKNYYIHQIYETVDFSTKNKVLTWLLGGLNFQVVHHLFHEVSHVHYP